MRRKRFTLGPWVAETHCLDIPGMVTDIRCRFIPESLYPWLTVIARTVSPPIGWYEDDQRGPRKNWELAKEMQTANALLIGAAPELYDAGDEALAALYGCREVVGDIGNIGHAIGLLESALDKASGKDFFTEGGAK